MSFNFASMKKNLFIFIALCFLLTECENEDSRITLLNYNVIHSDFIGAKRWLYAANANGEVLAMNEITAAGEFKLKGIPNGEQVDIGYVIRRPSGEKNIWMFYVFKGIEVGSSFDVGRNYPPQSTSGTARVVVRNYKELVSPLINLLYSTTFPGGIKSSDWTGEVVNTEITVGNNPSEVLVTGQRGNTPVYLKKENVTAGQTIEADFSTFLPMENIQVLDLVGITSTAGFRTNEPHSYYYNFENHRANEYVPTTGLLAYVAGYDYYQTSIFSIQPSKGVNSRHFLKLGPQLTSFSFPDVSISIDNEEVSSFSATLSAPYTFKYASFYSGDGDQSVSVFVYSDADGFSRFNDFPSQFKSMDPALKASDLSYTSVRFVSSNNTYTIEDEMRGMLGNNAPSWPFELYSFTN